MLVVVSLLLVLQGGGGALRRGKEAENASRETPRAEAIFAADGNRSATDRGRRRWFRGRVPSKTFNLRESTGFWVGAHRRQSLGQ